MENYRIKTDCTGEKQNEENEENKITILTLALVLTLAMTAGSAFGLTDRKINSTEKLYQNTAYDDVTIDKDATFDLNGCTLELHGNLKIKEGGSIKSGGLLFKSKRASAPDVDLYVNMRGKFYQINGGLEEIWDKWEYENYWPHLFYDYACKGYCFPSVAMGGAGYEIIDNGFKVVNAPGYEDEQIEIEEKKSAKLSDKVIKGVKNTKINMKSVSKPGNTDMVYAGVRWTKSGSYKVDGYKLYRATSKNGKYKLIATFKAGEVQGYRDTDVTKGKSYYYKVRGFRFGHGSDKESGTIYTPYSSSIKVSAK